MTIEGSIVMQVRGGKEVTLTPGQTFYEGPSDIHVVGRNARQTKPAKFVVFLVKDKGAPEHYKNWPDWCAGRFIGYDARPGFRNVGWQNHGGT